MPYADDVISLIANENGRYMIGDKIIQENRITSYDQLAETGQAYYIDFLPREIPNVVEKPDGAVSTASEPQRVDAHPLGVGIYSTKSKVGGDRYEFVQDWKKVGNGKKIRVTFGRILKKRSGNIPRLYWHAEVSFRKKGFLGRWYNYSSKTSFAADITYNDGTRVKFRGEASGASSHDGYYNCKVREMNPKSYIIYNKGYLSSMPKLIDPQPRKLFYFEGCNVKMTVTYRGMPDTIYLSDYQWPLWGWSNEYNKSFDY